MFPIGSGIGSCHILQGENLGKATYHVDNNETRQRDRVIGINIDTREFEEFRISEVNYINLTRPKASRELIPIYHTSKGSYAPLLTLRDLSRALVPHGFKHFDKSTLVNRKRILHTFRKKEGLKIVFVDFCEVIVSGRSRIR